MATFTAIAAICTTGDASAGIFYSTAESVYSEDFNTLPANSNPFTGALLRTNGGGHIQSNSVSAPNTTITPEWPAVFPGGWKDDATTDATNLGVPGWYLWSDVTTLTTANGGANGHVQFRYGGGNAASGTGFFAFSSTITSTNQEKALGLHSAAAFTDSASGRRSYIGLQLINNTSETLHSFTITYDGEQYREAAGANAADGFDLQWSLVASAAGWHDNPTSGGFYNNGVPGTDYGSVADSFKSPINNNPAAAAFLDGNDLTNRVAGISHLVSGITWAPGTELWIRWRDQFTHDGIAIDNVNFTASTEIPEPSAFLLFASTLLCRIGRRR
jgi:hypothetical protein